MAAKYHFDPAQSQNDPAVQRQKARVETQGADVAKAKGDLARQVNYANTIYRQRKGIPLDSNDVNKVHLPGAPDLSRIHGPNDIKAAWDQLNLTRQQNKLPGNVTAQDLDAHDKALSEGREYKPVARNQAQPPLPRQPVPAEGIAPASNPVARSDKLVDFPKQPGPLSGIPAGQEGWIGGVPKGTPGTTPAKATPPATAAPATPPTSSLAPQDAARAANIRAQLVNEGRIAKDGTVIPAAKAALAQDPHGVDYLNRLADVYARQTTDQIVGRASGAGFDSRTQGDAFAKLAAEAAPAGAPAVNPNAYAGVQRAANGTAFAMNAGGQVVGSSRPGVAPSPLDSIPANPSNIAGNAAAVQSGANLTTQAPNNIAPSALTPAVNTPANPVDALAQSGAVATPPGYAAGQSLAAGVRSGLDAIPAAAKGVGDAVSSAGNAAVNFARGAVGAAPSDNKITVTETKGDGIIHNGTGQPAGPVAVTEEQMDEWRKRNGIPKPAAAEFAGF